jgi:hypothetical protein
MTENERLYKTFIEFDRTLNVSNFCPFRKTGVYAKTSCLIGARNTTFRGPPMAAASRFAIPNRVVVGAYDPLLREIGSTQENQPIFLRTLATKMVFDKNI